jgi:hypothetical protein
MTKKDVSLLSMSAPGRNEMVGGDLPHEIQNRFKLKEPEKSLARFVGLNVQRVSEILRQAEPHPCTGFRPVARILACFRSYG